MKKVAVAVLVACSPLLVMAEVLGGVTDLVDALPGIVQTLIGVVIGLAVLVFFWGLVKYIANANDPEKAKEGKSIMIWGVVAIFVMASVWGIVEFLRNQFGIDGGEVDVPVPTLGQ